MRRTDHKNDGARTLVGLALVAAVCVLWRVPLIAQEVRLSGSVVDVDGQPLEQVQVVLAPMPLRHAAGTALLEGRDPRFPDGPGAGAVSTDAEGRFEITVRPGNHRLHLSQGGYVDAALDLLALFDDRGLQPIALDAAETLLVDVQDGDGQAVPGAVVEVFGQRPSAWRRGREFAGAVPGTATTNAQGRATFDIVAGAEYSLAVRSEGHSLSVLRGATGDRQMVRLEVGSPVVFRALVGTDRVAAGALVRLGGVAVGVTDDQGLAVVHIASETSRAWTVETAELAMASGELEAGPLGPDTVIKAKVEVHHARGQVIDQAGRLPIANAWVWHSRDPGRVVTSGPRGAFDLPLPSKGGGRVFAALPGYRMAERRLQGQNTDDLILEVEQSQALTGRTIDAEGRPIAAARLTVTPHMSARGSHRAQVATSDADGGFEIGELDDQIPYTLSVYAPTWKRKTLQLPPGIVEPLEIVLEPGVAARGFVVDASGAPVANAEVTATIEPPESATFEEVAQFSILNRSGITAETDGEGAFTFADLEPATYELEARAPGFAPLTVPRVEMGAEEGQDIGTLELVPGATLQGRVVDSEGEGVSGARLILKRTAQRQFNFAGRNEKEAEATSDSEGRFDIVDLAPEGTYTLVAMATGFAPRTLANAKAGRAEVRLLLRREAAIEGRVTGRDGKPVPQGWVMVENENLRAAGTFTFPGRENVGEDGTFRVGALEPATYTLLASAEGLAAQTRAGLTLEEGQVLSGVEMVLGEGAVLFGVVLAGDRVPVPNARVRIEPDFQSTRGSLAIQAASKIAISSGDGSYRLAGLRPGPQTVVVQSEDHPDLTLSVNLEEGETRRDLELPSGYRISGVVLDPEESPAPGVDIRVVRGSGNQMMRGMMSKNQSRADGTFETEPLAEGSWAVIAEGRGFAPARTDPPIELRSDVSGIELRLERGGRLEGLVLGLALDDLQRLSVTLIQQSTMTFRQAQPDHEGRFAVDGLLAGSWQVNAQVGQGERSLRETVDVEVGSPTELTLRFEAGFTVAGTATRGGQPAANERLLLTGGREGQRQVVTDQAGRFSLAGVAAGEYILQSASGVGRRETVLVEADLDLEWPLDGSIVEGRVLTNDDHPLSGATVSLSLVGSSQLRRFGGVTSRADGGFVFQDVAPGDYRLQATAPGRAAATVVVTVDETGVIAPVFGPVDLVMSPAGALTLAITRVDGTVVDQVTLIARDLDGHLVSTAFLQAGSNGLTKVDGLGQGRFDLTLLTFADAERVRVDIPSSEPVPVVLAPTARVTVRVPELEETPTPASAVLYDQNGDLSRFTYATDLVQGWPVLAGGLSFTLPAGSYSVLVRAANGDRVWRKAFTVATGTPLEVVLE